MNSQPPCESSESVMTRPCSRNRRAGGMVTVLGGLGLLAVLAVLYRFAPEQYAFYPKCAFHAMTGWQCPGCGGLRAMHALLHGHWREAWGFHPLLVLGLGVGLMLAPVVLAESITGRRWLPRPRGVWWIWCVLGGILISGLGRNLI